MSIEINVGGTIFKTQITTLKKINYFKYLLEDTTFDCQQVMFVDRAAHIFKHVLALAIDNNYNYPLKFQSELDFYDVDYDIKKLYNPLDIENNIKTINDNIQYLTEYVGVLDHGIGLLMKKTNGINTEGYLCMGEKCYRTRKYCAVHNN